MAMRFRDEGRYNWFRGQVHQWPPYSSAYRVDDEERRALADRRMNLFLQWVTGTPELQHLMSDHAALAAVAQHYGIPTHQIDFTTEPGVAGFFAADGDGPPDGDAEPCIYCVNTDDLMEVWEMMKEGREGGILELVTIDVSNLWRLEAQRGVFLFCNYNWDVDYPMDRILFPPSGYPSWPTKEDIYPPQKSPLEALLDQYFDLEQKVMGSEWLRKMVNEMQQQGANVHWLHDETPDNCYHPDATKTGELPVLASWAPEALKDWNPFNVERMETTIAAPVTLKVKPDASVLEAARAVSYGAGQVLNTKRNARQTTFTWQFQELTPPDRTKVETLSNALQNICDGMRRLPYTNQEIATACGTTTRLGFSVDPSLEVVERVLEDCFQVEFAANDNSSSRGYIQRETLRSALRSDLAEYASEQLLSNMNGDVKWVLQGIFSPSRLLEFDALRAMFVNELIPTQVLSRKLVLYSPARLLTFGLP